jgi:hypothetical protein
LIKVDLEKEGEFYMCDKAGAVGANKGADKVQSMPVKKQETAQAVDKPLEQTVTRTPVQEQQGLTTNQIPPDVLKAIFAVLQGA